MTDHQAEPHADDRSHEPWTDRFSDYLDDELAADERQAIERHLRECPPCAAVLDDLRRVIETAAGLQHPALNLEGPGQHVWEAVASRVHQLPRTALAGAKRRYSFSLPQLAAAGVLLALLSGWGALRLVMRSEVDRQPVSGSAVDSRPVTIAEPIDLGGFELSDPQYDAAVSDLEQVLERDRGRLDPDTVATVEADLLVIDQALDEARRALMNDPANSYLSGHVVDTRQRKLDLLRRAAALTTDSQM